MHPDRERDLRRFLAEDVGTGDITSALLPAKQVRARVISRQAGVLAGARYAKRIFEMKGCRASVKTRDGGRLVPGRTVMEIRGDPRRLLACERTALNLLSRMSGIATQTDRLARMLPRGVGLFATRKTAPGLRAFDKEAVRTGGGHAHRMGLDGAVLFKDNHLAVGLSIGELLGRAGKRHRGIEIEVGTKREAVTAAQNGASVIMLDNFTPGRVRDTVAGLEKMGLRGRVRLEASGGITEKNIGRYARTGVDMISSGSITNSVAGLDLSLEILTRTA